MYDAEMNNLFYGADRARRHFSHVTQMFCDQKPLHECLSRVKEMQWQVRHAFFSLSKDAENLYAPDFVATCSMPEEKLLHRGLACMPPAKGMALLRGLLASAEMLPREMLLRFVNEPFLEPILVLGTADKDGKPESLADAAGTFVNRALRSFGLKASRIRNTIRPIEDGSISSAIGRNYGDLLPLVRSDATAGVRIAMDIRLRKPTRSFIAMLYRHGGPACQKMLLRSETYAGTGIGAGSLAALAVIAQKGDEAVETLEALEAESPGTLKAQRDAAGRNLLWYLALRDRIWIYGAHHHESCEPSMRPGDIGRVRDVLLAAGCDPDATDEFGFRWSETLDYWRRHDVAV